MAKETINNGWICLHRAMREWQHYDNVFIKAVFIDLLLSATSKPCWSCGIRLTRGQTLRSSRKIEEDNKISRPTVLRALRTLEESGEIIREKISQKLVKTTIVNYSKYQDFSLVSGKNEIPQRLPQRLPQSLPLTTREQDNNIIDYKNNSHTHEDIFTNIKKSAILIEQFCKTEGITADQFNNLVDEVQVDWALTNEKDQTKKHLLNAVRCKITNLREGGRLVRGTLAERKQRFLGECKALVDKGCDRESVAEFARYYTQLERGGERMLFETYKGWNTETRYLINQQLKLRNNDKEQNE